MFSLYSEYVKKISKKEGDDGIPIACGGVTLETFCRRCFHAPAKNKRQSHIELVSGG